MRTKKDATQVRSILIGRIKQIENRLDSNMSVLQGDTQLFEDSIDVNSELVNVDANELAEYKSALSRLDAGKYGDCSECNQPIPLARLEVLPFATRCLKCQSNVEKNHVEVEPQRHAIRS